LSAAKYRSNNNNFFSCRQKNAPRFDFRNKESRGQLEIVDEQGELCMFGGLSCDLNPEQLYMIKSYVFLVVVVVLGEKTYGATLLNDFS
jgi:hypothetical protein